VELSKWARVLPNTWKWLWGVGFVSEASFGIPLFFASAVSIVCHLYAERNMREISILWLLCFGASQGLCNFYERSLLKVFYKILICRFLGRLGLYSQVQLDQIIEKEKDRYKLKLEGPPVKANLRISKKST